MQKLPDKTVGSTGIIPVGLLAPCSKHRVRKVVCMLQLLQASAAAGASWTAAKPGLEGCHPMQVALLCFECSTISP